MRASKPMRWVFVEERALPIWMVMVFATASTRVWVQLTIAECATVPVPSTIVGAPTSQRVTATVMGTNSTPLACAAVSARLISMAMASVMWMRYLAA